MSASSALTSTIVPADRGVDVGHRLGGLDLAEALAGLDRRSRPRGADEDDVAERVLGVVGDADADPAALEPGPLVVLASSAGRRGRSSARNYSTPLARGVGVIAPSIWRMRRAYSWASRRASRVAVGLGPDVGDRLLGVGQRQRPAVVVEDLHAVDQHELAVARLRSIERAHHRALLLPRRDDRLVGHVDGRAGRRPPRTAGRRVRASSSSSLTQRGGGVEGGQEAGEDEAAVEARRRSPRRRLGRRLHQRRRGQLRPARPRAAVGARSRPRRGR